MNLYHKRRALTVAGVSPIDLAQNAATRFAALSSAFDPNTMRHLLAVGLQAGWHCLEVGGGGGSIACWLANYVGPGGEVTVTDVDTRFLEPLAGKNLRVLRHDVVRDPLPEQAFDLVHTRMVLIHLPERDDVLVKLAAALRPGGWLVCEEFDGISAGVDPRAGSADTVLKIQQAMDRLSSDRHVDRAYGRRLFGRFRGMGLTSIGADGQMTMVQAGSPLATLLSASYRLRRDAMIAAGYVTAEEFDADLARMATSEFVMPSPVMWTAWGRRPKE